MEQIVHIGFLLFPNVTQLDLTGPLQVLSRVPGARVHLIAKNMSAVPTDVAGFTLNPTVTFDECPALDVLCVPGGFGVAEQVGDGESLAFLRRIATPARYVTSVCNGALLLGAAGLLEGYGSACHWMWRPYLSYFGARPVVQRVVRDRNRISGGGVTAGIDFGFVLAAELAGEETAKMIQLGLEYDPQAPFACGTPELAGEERVGRMRAMLAERMKTAEDKLLRASRNR